MRMPPGRIADRVDVQPGDVASGVVSFEALRGTPPRLNEPHGVPRVHLMDDVIEALAALRNDLAQFRLVRSLPNAEARMILILGDDAPQFALRRGISGLRSVQVAYGHGTEQAGFGGPRQHPVDACF